MNISIIFHRLGPYHHARLEALGRYCNLTAIELTTVDNTYAWAPVATASGFKKITLFVDVDIEEKSPAEVRHTLWRALAESAPQVVAIPGWAMASSLLALDWCIQRNVPAVVMSDSQECDEPRKWWKEWIKSRLVKQFTAGFVAGVSHRRYLEKLGLPYELIYLGYDVVDNDYFANRSAQVHSTRDSVLNELALPRKYFLNSCRFVPKKNLSRLIAAYAKYKRITGETAWHLIILGDGPLRPELEAQIASLDLDGWVHLPGFKQYHELPVYYGLASAYVQPSTTEQWGLVVNEAMAAGLPVLVSERCGCAQDLVRGGTNGFTFNPEDVDGLAALMVKITSDEVDLESMSRASRETISRWTPETFAENLLRAGAAALAAPQPRAGYMDRLLLRGLSCR